MNRVVVTLAATAALLFGGTAVTALPPPPAPPAATPAPVVPGGALSGIGGLAGSLLDGVLAPLAEPAAPTSPPEPSGGSEADPEAAVSSAPTAAPAGPLSSPFSGLAPGAFAGYATGTAFHQTTDDAERIEVGFSGAAYSSAPLPARDDELGRSVAPGLAAAQGFGRGSGVELGLDLMTDDELTLEDNAEATAPPNRDVVTNELTGVDLSPIIDADVLRAQAAARTAGTGCVVGSDLAYGLGLANRTRAVEDEKKQPVLSLSDDDPPQAVTQSVSRTRLVPPPAGTGVPRFGLLAETRQTIAPITLFEGEPEELVVEVGGEWVLRAMADGTQGSIAYGPESESADVPVLRIFRPNGKGHMDDEVLTEVDLQTASGGTGEDLGVPGVFQLYLGEDPRAIGGDAESEPVSTGTLVGAAADVVRVRIPDPEGGVLELRVGHLEVAVSLPAEGITCPGIGMVKESDPPAVRPGERFDWTITISNANDCELNRVKVVDTISTTPGVRYRIVSSRPAGRAGDGTLTFEGIGAIRLGESRTIRIVVEVAEDAPPGSFTDEAVASGTCGPVPVGGGAEVVTGVGAAASEPVPMDGRVILTAPEIRTAAAVAPNIPGPAPVPVVAGAVEVRPRVDAAPAPGRLARTGGFVGLLPALTLLVTSTVLRRLGRRR